jgi:hypothetical protein
MATAVNYKGVDSVCSYIEQTSRNYFAIYQAGKLNQPVFKCITGGSNAKAVKAFRDWANVIIGGDPDHSLSYEIRMYDKVDGDEGEEGDVKIRAGRQGLSATFCLNSKNIETNLSVVSGAPVGFISPDLMDAKLENQRLTFELLRQQDKFAALEARLDDLENDDEGDSVGGIEDSPLLKMFMPLIQAHLAKPQAGRAVVNGIGETDRLSDAICRLKKHDPRLEDHICKLAQIAETNQGTFAFLLNTLDNM